MRKTEIGKDDGLHAQLVELATWSRDVAIKNLSQVRDSNPQLASLNAWSICTASFTRSVTEWRLGDADPSPFFRQYLDDSHACLSISKAAESESVETTIRLTAFISIYVQLLLGSPIDREFREAIRQPRKFAPASKQKDGFDGSEWDNVVLELAETGMVPEQFAGLYAYMEARKKRHHWEVHCATMRAYREIIEAAVAGDSRRAKEAILLADALFTRRSHGDITWGGGDIADRTADIRLACVIKKAEEISPGVTIDAKTPHRWRW